MPRRTWGWHQLDPRWAQQLVTDAGLRPRRSRRRRRRRSGARSRGRSSSSARASSRSSSIPRRAAQLRAEFGDDIVVVEADAADLRLPRRDFHVVANPPFGITNALVRSARAARQPPRVRAPGAPGLGGPSLAGPGRARRAGDGVRSSRSWRDERLPRAAFRPAAPRSGRVLVIRRQTRASGAGRPRAPTSAAGTRSIVPSRSGCAELSAVTTMRSDSSRAEEHEARHGLRRAPRRTVERAVGCEALDPAAADTPRPTRRLRCPPRGRRARHPSPERTLGGSAHPRRRCSSIVVHQDRLDRRVGVIDPPSVRARSRCRSTTRRRHRSASPCHRCRCDRPRPPCAPRRR